MKYFFIQVGSWSGNIFSTVYPNTLIFFISIGANWIYSRYAYALAVRKGKNMLMVCLWILLS